MLTFTVVLFINFHFYEFTNMHVFQCTNRDTSPQDLYTMTLVHTYVLRLTAKFLEFLIWRSFLEICKRSKLLLVNS